MSYGIPYQGSKQGIVKEICRYFPSADNFYDLFGGGFSVTHFMLLHRAKDFKQFHYNEIRPGITDLVKRAISGEFNYNVFKPEFITREKFFERKDRDPYIKMIWSFGNDGNSYLFGKDIEPYKQSMHNAVIFNRFDSLAKSVFGFNRFQDGFKVQDKRYFLGSKIEYYRRNGVPDYLKRFISSKPLEQLQRLQRLQQLQQLERLQQLQQLEMHNKDYRDVLIKDNSIIYCDIPYKGTGEYDKNKNFNHKIFYDWARSIDQPLFISEYNISEPGLIQVWAKNVKSKMSPKGGTDACEKLYCNKIAYRSLIELKKQRRKRAA